MAKSSLIAPRSCPPVSALSRPAFTSQWQSRKVATEIVWLSKPEKVYDLCLCFVSFCYIGHLETQASEAATILNVCKGKEDFLIVSYKQLNVWPRSNMCYFCSEFVGPTQQKGSSFATGLGVGELEIFDELLWWPQMLWEINNHSKLIGSARSFSLLNSAAWEDMEKNSAGMWAQVFHLESVSSQPPCNAAALFRAHGKWVMGR